MKVDLLYALFIVIIISTTLYTAYHYNKSSNIKKIKNQEAKIMQTLHVKLDQRINDLKQTNQQLDIKVNQDALTQLKNRYFLNDKTKEFIQTQPDTFSFLYLDLDNFKIINDVQGHNIGDIVLQVIAKRLMEFDTENIDVCRIGGDEFILLTPESDYDKLAKLASQITASIIKPIEIDNMNFSVGVSIGIATIPTSVRRFKDLLRSAEIAMYIAKQKDGSNHTVFYQSSRSETVKRSNILALSLNSNKLFKELRLKYLPIIDMKSNQMIAAEVNLLWSHSELGTVDTDEFLTIIDQTDKTEKVMSWFIKKSIEEIAKWQVKYNMPIKLHIKLSVQTLSIIELPKLIENTLLEYNLSPADLCIDIKESTIVKSYKMIKDTLRDISQIGVKIAISEFGDNKTAFHLLRKVHFDYIKFAKTFIDTIDQNNRDIAILKAMIKLSYNLNRIPVIPYIERKTQLSTIENLDVSLGSGNYLRHALSSDDFVEYYLETTDDNA